MFQTTVKEISWVWSTKICLLCKLWEAPRRTEELLALRRQHWQLNYHEQKVEKITIRTNLENAQKWETRGERRGEMCFCSFCQTEDLVVRMSKLISSRPPWGRCPEEAVKVWVLSSPVHQLTLVFGQGLFSASTSTFSTRACNTLSSEQQWRHVATRLLHSIFSSLPPSLPLPLSSTPPPSLPPRLLLLFLWKHVTWHEQTCLAIVPVNLQNGRTPLFARRPDRLSA